MVDAPRDGDLANANARIAAQSCLASRASGTAGSTSIVTTSCWTAWITRACGPPASESPAHEAKQPAMMRHVLDLDTVPLCHPKLSQLGQRIAVHYDQLVKRGYSE